LKNLNVLNDFPLWNQFSDLKKYLSGIFFFLFPGNIFPKFFPKKITGGFSFSPTPFGLPPIFRSCRPESWAAIQRRASLSGHAIPASRSEAI
jgi:hypothetical protein